MKKNKEIIENLRKEAIEWVEKNGPSGFISVFPNRSCWKCNPAHEHLKTVNYPIKCFFCNHVYFKGIDITDEE
jgi:hypothetical protein